MIYLASPYTHTDKETMELRWKRACEACANIMREGKFVYSPIAHCHDISQFGLPTTWDFWERYDTEMITRCDHLWVLMLDGWSDSIGVSAEIDIATNYGIPITYIESEEYVNFQCKNM